MLTPGLAVYLCSPEPTLPSAGPVTVSATKTSDWGTGYTGEFTIKNTKTTAVLNWYALPGAEACQCIQIARTCHPCGLLALPLVKAAHKGVNPSWHYVPRVTNGTRPLYCAGS